MLHMRFIVLIISLGFVQQYLYIYLYSSGSSSENKTYENIGTRILFRKSAFTEVLVLFGTLDYVIV